MMTYLSKTLKVHELEPQQKHPAIFSLFDELEPGQSIIIENDHDPKPLFFELRFERKSELGSFEYLESGPDIWKVRITRALKNFEAPESTGSESEFMTGDHLYNDTCATILRTETVADSCSVNHKSRSSKNLPTLDVTILPPKLKHPTIFDWFNNLEPGESFRLHNDHDPKPLYYQMLGELGPVFNWQYEIKGPERWMVVIQKQIPGEVTIGEIAAKDARKAKAMKKMGIDFCCGGLRSVKQAIAEAGITPAYFNRVLADSEETPQLAKNNFDRWDADFLAEYIYNEHHKYFYECRDEVLILSKKVRDAHADMHPELISLTEVIERLFTELNAHFFKEEKVLFPYIKELANASRSGDPLKIPLNLNAGPLTLMHIEHEEAGNLLKSIRNLANNFKLPFDACNSYRALYSMLEELETDIHQHVHLENNVLFPKALALEKGLIS